MVAGGQKDRLELEPGRVISPGFPEGPSVQCLDVGICSTQLHGAWHYKEPGITRSLASQGSTPRGEDKSICFSKKCYNSFWLLLSVRQGQGELKEMMEGWTGVTQSPGT